MTHAQMTCPFDQSATLQIATQCTNARTPPDPNMKARQLLLHANFAHFRIFCPEGAQKNAMYVSANLSAWQVEATKCKHLQCKQRPNG